MSPLLVFALLAPLLVIAEVDPLSDAEKELINKLKGCDCENTQPGIALIEPLVVVEVPETKDIKLDSGATIKVTVNKIVVEDLTTFTIDTVKTVGNELVINIPSAQVTMEGKIKAKCTTTKVGKLSFKLKNSEIRFLFVRSNGNGAFKFTRARMTGTAVDIIFERKRMFSHREILKYSRELVQQYVSHRIVEKVIAVFNHNIQLLQQCCLTKVDNQQQTHEDEDEEED